jgi:CubicO group peptidase (beta-lactamase class C family)
MAEPVDHERFRGTDAVVAAGVGAAFPGAVLGIGWRGSLVHLQAFGRMWPEPGAPAVEPDTIYDLASLTKVVVTTTLAMILADEGRLDLDARVRDHFPRFSGGGKDEVRLRHLLSHSGGLLWWAPLYEELHDRGAFLERIIELPLSYEPGSAAVYSDLGFLLLGEVLERLGGMPFETLARDRVLEPLGMHDTGYCPGPQLQPRVAPTEDDPWRGRRLRGEVHDENAFALGGVAPHAGLFGTARDVMRLGQLMLARGVLEGRRILDARTVEHFTRRAGVPGSTRALGWDTAVDETGRRSSTPGEPGYSSAGSLLSPRSFGQTGFTGTSIWIDPEREICLVLLTNRVCPTRRNDAIRAVRARLADAVAVALPVR